MKKILYTITGLVFIAVFASTAQAQMCGCMDEDGGMRGGGMMGGMGEHRMGMQGMSGMQGPAMMMDDDHPLWKHLMSLGLDDKQKDALKAIHSRVMKDMVKRKADLQIARIELNDLLDKEPVDMKSVEMTVKKKEFLKAEMSLAHLRAHEEMKAVLTSDQRKQLKAMMEPGHPGCSMMGEYKDMPMHEHSH